jgi:hypothetical protein
VRLGPISKQRVEMAHSFRRDMIFEAVLVHAILALDGISSAEDTISAGDYNVGETMTRHRSRYYGSRPFAVVQA